MLLFFFTALAVVNMNKCVVPTQVASDAVVLVELDTFGVYMMLKCSHCGGEFSDRDIDTFFEEHLLQFSSFTSPFIKSGNSSFLVIIAITVACIGDFRI